MARGQLMCLAALLGAACTWQGTPVPIAGPTQTLEGEWEGTYSSVQTGRTGSILFRLKAGTDSAYGDVVMMLAGEDEVKYPLNTVMPQAHHASSRVLGISFVQCEPGRVTGQLDPYQDPESGERVLTTFEGRQRGDEFRGTFSSLYPATGRRLTGEWTATRKHH
jgi:hypothetical protein